MYYIYDRNPFVCIVPSITIVGLLGEFRFPPMSILHSIVIS